MAIKMKLPTCQEPSRGIHQPGITDPSWPIETPDGIETKDYQYFAGRISLQDCLTLVFADIDTANRNELKSILKSLSDFAVYEMQRKPSRDGVPPQVAAILPDTYRVTITIGFGASLFTTPEGDDRFGIRHMRPKSLKVMPQFPGADKDGFFPDEHATDIVVQICSDHPYVNTHIAKGLHQYKFGTGLKIKRLEQGFARQDTRESLQFDDGISNLRKWPDNTMERLAYVQSSDNDLPWCVGGSYMVYRKMAENLPKWEGLTDMIQSEMIGRDKASGRPLSRQTSCPAYDPDCQDFDKMPVYPDPTDDADGPVSSHMRKVQPRRPDADLFGINDLDRTFLRRPYPYFDGIGVDGEPEVGLHFVAFMRSITRQFEHVVQMWQTNPDFPVPGTGIDILHREKIIQAISGGYYFCPPTIREGQKFIGEALFD